MDNQEIRKIAFTLRSLDSGEVVKVAGILKRFKNFWKRFSDPDYREARKQVNEEATAIRATGEALVKKISALESAIKDGDVELYKLYLEEVKDLTHEFWNTLQSVEKKTNLLWYYTENEMSQPGFMNKFKRHLPENYDIEPDKLYRRSLKSFRMYGNITPDIFSIDPNSAPIGYLVKLVLSTVSPAILKEYKEKGEGLEIIGDFKTKMIEDFKAALLNGLLIKATAHKPHGEVKHLPAGLMSMMVKTAPFRVQINDIVSTTVQVSVEILDYRTTISPAEVIKLRSVLKIDKIASEQNQFTKLAAANFSAWKALPDDFWVEFVKMAGRIGAKPEDLAQVIYAESAFDSHATNEQGGETVARGLNQLVHTTATSPNALGMSESDWNSFENKSAIEQLPWVEKYFKNIQNRKNINAFNSVAQLYLANFSPGNLSPEANDATVLYRKGHSTYDRNRGLDADNKGYIAIGDLEKFVKKSLGPTGMLPTEMLFKLNQAEQKLGVIPVKKENSQKDPVADELNKLDEFTGELLLNTGKVSSFVREELIKQAIESNKLPFTKILITFENAIDHKRMGQLARVIENGLRTLIRAQQSQYRVDPTTKQYIVSATLWSARGVEDEERINSAKVILDILIKEFNRKFNSNVQYKVSAQPNEFAVEEMKDPQYESADVLLNRFTSLMTKQKVA